MTATNITFSQPGKLTVKGAALLAKPQSDDCHKFLETLFRIPEVEAIEINSRRMRAEIHIGKKCSQASFLQKLGDTIRSPNHHAALLEREQVFVDDGGCTTLYRNGDLLTAWKTESDLPGRLRLSHPKLLRNKSLCHEIERELMTVHGVDRFKIQPTTSSTLIYFSSHIVSKAQIIQFLNAAIIHAKNAPEEDEGSKYELALCTVTAVAAATAQFAYPVLLLPTAALFIYCGIPTFIGAWEVLTKERRLGVDVLDAIVIVMCLLSGELFAGAVLTWCLSFGRKLLAKAREDSRRRLVNVFGKQPRSAYVLIDGEEVNVTLDKIQAGSIVVVHTGEMIPVDGTVTEGNAIVDQHALTGESVPVEKHEGSRVYASTLLIGGRILIAVEKAGKETTSAKISAILNDTASFRLSSQSKGEEYADRAVIPTLALSLLGYGAVNLQAATAIINCDFGTGIRMAAPIGLLSCLSVCSSRGILIKDGSALEQMASIDTMLFDKTGTLTQERPTLHKVHKLDKMSEDQILTYAAAAEKRVGHPIAQAIVAEFERLGIPMPATDESSFKVGYGINVTAGGKKVFVGSSRYLVSEGFTIQDDVGAIADAANAEGHSLVFVAVGKKVVGAIELAPTLREGIPELIAALRARGIKDIVIISGDHKKPTENLAKKLKVDRFFSDVLPEDKAHYVEILQSEGRKVCFVGDGINDSIALKKANVSVSLRGATSVATDTAQVVFMEESLNRLIDFIDISQMLERNVRTSWHLILVPNLLCIGGAFFFGFGVMASVLANNVAAIAALANGLLPLRKIASEAKPPPLAHKPQKEESDITPPEMHAQPIHQPSSAAQPATPQQSQPPHLNDYPPIKNARKVATISLVIGIAGLALPVLPGWLLVMSSIGIFARVDPRLAVLDRVIQRKFPLTSQDAVFFVNAFVNDIEKRFAERARQKLEAEAVAEAARTLDETNIIDVDAVEIVEVVATAAL